MGQARSTHGTEEQHVHGFGEKIYAYYLKTDPIDTGLAEVN
jgi:hypothetical protein